VALASEFARRGLDLPVRFETPDRGLWEPGYAAEARRSLLTAERTLGQASARVAPFLDPLLDGSAAGLWEPARQRWIS